MPFRYPLLTLLAGVLVSQVAAQSPPPSSTANGHTLLAECGDVVSFVETGVSNDFSVGGSYCLGMVNGMLNLNTIYQAEPGRQPLFCVPREPVITNAEAARVVVDYLKAHPDQLNLDQASLMFFAFEKAWPCP
ncbi:MAG: Rap1a/Tai family immunity protein [Pseudomonadota bacterium]|nr:Rap1a/Tai family immunity protein [Pseudomonadota bacterium]